MFDGATSRSHLNSFFKGCEFGCLGSCADFNEGRSSFYSPMHKQCTEADGYAKNKCADADHPTCEAHFPPLELRSPTYLMDAIQNVGTPGFTGQERVATDAWMAAASAVCESKNLDDACPNACKLAGRVVHGCTTLLSSPKNCEAIESHFSVLMSPLADNASSLSAADLDLGFWFGREGSGPDPATSLHIDSYPASPVDAHCIGTLDSTSRVPGSFVDAKRGCYDKNARMCTAAEVELHARASSASTSRLEDGVMYWTQSTERVAGSAGGCAADEVLAAGVVSGAYKEECHARSATGTAATMGLCCGDDTSFIVS